MREKRKNCDDSEAGLRKQAKLVDNILEHTSRHNKSTKARLLAKIINREGPQFTSTSLQPPKGCLSSGQPLDSIGVSEEEVEEDECMIQ